MGGGVKLNLCTLGKRSTAGRQLQVFFLITLEILIVCDLLSIHMTDLKQGEEENIVFLRLDLPCPLPSEARKGGPETVV